MTWLDRVRETCSYWERARIIYNLVLAVFVIVIWGPDMVAAGPSQWLGAALVLVLFATLANLAYCTVYPLDFILQITPVGSFWKRHRWVIFSAGVILAVIIELWIMLRPGMA